MLQAGDVEHLPVADFGAQHPLAGGVERGRRNPRTEFRPHPAVLNWWTQ